MLLIWPLTAYSNDCSKFQTKRSVKFRIKPDSLSDGVLLYAAENEKTYGDFLAVLLKDGHVELRYSVAGSKKAYTNLPQILK